MSTLLTVQNLSVKVTDAEVSIMTSGLSTLLTIFCSDWNIRPVELITLTKEQTPTTKLCVYIMDVPDVSGAFGYHDVINDSPYGKVFVNPILSNGGATLLGKNPNAPTVAQTLSHEVFEMLIDLYCNMWWHNLNGRYLVAGEVSDPVQANIVRLQVGTTTVGYGDWILPRWTDSQATTGPFNHLNTLTAPFTMSKGGYLIKMTAGSVNNVFGEAMPGWVQDIKKESSRYLKRMAYGNQF